MPWLEILVLLALVLLNGYFAMAELAVVSARPARLEALARQKASRAARQALALARDPGRVLSTVQIGITLVGISAGAFGAARLAEPLGAALARAPLLAPISEEIAYALTVVVITYLSLIVGELGPSISRCALQSASRRWWRRRSTFCRASARRRSGCSIGRACSAARPSRPRR
jgi:putative hemolysin